MGIRFGRFFRLGVLLALSLAYGCTMTHRVAFDETDTSWHYQVSDPRQDASIVVVISPETRDQISAVRSLMAGGANQWEVEVGHTLAQVADVELPQLFAHYEAVTSYKEPESGARRITLALEVLRYDFSEFHSTVEIHATAYGPSKVVLFNKTYAGEGESQGAKMFWLGAFGMKSAIRQSTLDAYKKTFVGLRADLLRALQDPLSLA